jgi:hypothetical protein
MMEDLRDRINKLLELAHECRAIWTALGLIAPDPSEQHVYLRVVSLLDKLAYHIERIDVMTASAADVGSIETAVKAIRTGLQNLVSEDEQRVRPIEDINRVISSLEQALFETPLSKCDLPPIPFTVYSV